MLNQIFKVKDVSQINKHYFVLEVPLEKANTKILPGQFFTLKNLKYSYPMLKKPISVYDFDRNSVSFMIKRVGLGSEHLSLLKSGDEVEMLGPLGNGFPIRTEKNVVLVSGGIGYPPLFFLKKELQKAGKDVYWLHGGRCNEDVFPADEIWSDDGSCGTQGFVTQGLSEVLKNNKPDIIYACGPMAMLKTCSELAGANQIPLFVSLEEYMACGIGVCHGCAVKVMSENSIGVDYKTVCKDGPVFDAKDVVWE